MAQYLTEEQIEDRSELFLTILDDFITENYDLNEKYEMTEDDAYIVSIMMDHFNESFKFPSLNESVMESVTGQDINQALYQELAETLMDESIGTFVAGAAHGIRNALSKFKANRATAGKQKAKSEFEKHTVKPGSNKLKADAAHKELQSKSYKSGVMGTAKKSFDQARVAANKARAEKAKSAMKTAETARKSATAKHQSNVAKSGALAHKIDKGVENVKNRVKSAITTGAAKVGGFLGKHFG